MISDGMRPIDEGYLSSLTVVAGILCQWRHRGSGDSMSSIWGGKTEGSGGQNQVFRRVRLSPDGLFSVAIVIQDG